ncbi:hypothetical protein G9A89_018134 [Geosiphon pyriformis]|nr:hypothetical protein G9A89_018134 [Geosiphon pyriformis]
MNFPNSKQNKLYPSENIRESIKKHLISPQFSFLSKTTRISNDYSFYKRTDNGNEVYPKKRPFNNTQIDEIGLLKWNAAFANMAYCEPFKSYNFVGSLVKNGKDIFGNLFEATTIETIVVHFRAPILSKTDWFNRKSELEPFRVPGMKANALVLVDKEWFVEVVMMMNEMISVIYHLIEESHFTKITFCGHGVGGAYAAIAGLSFTILDLIGLRPLGIKFKGTLDISIYTFGYKSYSSK